MTTQPQFRAVTERRNLDNIALHANLVGGAGFTGVLLWNLAAFVNNGIAVAAPPAGTWPAPVNWATELNAVATGTTVKILRRGVWLATFSANVPASQTTVFGISYASDDPAQLSNPGLTAAATPINTAAGIRQGMTTTTAAANVTPVTLAALITVSDRDAGDLQSGIIRFHGTGGGAAGIIETADVTGATVRYTIAYVNDSMGS
jgi:hypothetical protein